MKPQLLREKEALKALPKKNKDTKCHQCGVCCHVDMTAYVTEEDIRRWKNEGRDDIIAHFTDNNVIWIGDHFIRKTGQAVSICFYLNRNGSSFFCEIHPTRPMVCRNYVPGSSELCSRYYEEE